MTTLKYLPIPYIFLLRTQRERGKVIGCGCPYIPYFLECFSPSNCIRPLIVYAQLSGLNVYCVRPLIVFARCSKRCARAIVIRKDNPLSGNVSVNRKVKRVWMVRKKWQKKLQMQQKWQKVEVQQKRGFLM